MPAQKTIQKGSPRKTQTFHTNTHTGRLKGRHTGRPKQGKARQKGKESAQRLQNTGAAAQFGKQQTQKLGYWLAENKERSRRRHRQQRQQQQ